MDDNLVGKTLECPKCHENSTDNLLIGDGQEDRMPEDEVICESCGCHYRLTENGQQIIESHDVA